jgi:hypothetical protein
MMLHVFVVVAFGYLWYNNGGGLFIVNGDVVSMEYIE